MFNKLIDRFREPSSWASLAVLFTLVGLNIDEGLWRDVVMAGTGVAGILGFWLREKKVA